MKNNVLLENYRKNIDGTDVARYLMEFQIETNNVYETRAVGPMQTFLGFCITKGYLTNNKLVESNSVTKPKTIFTRIKEYFRYE